MAQKTNFDKAGEAIGFVLVWGFVGLFLFAIVDGCVGEPLPPMTPKEQYEYDMRQLEYDEIEARQPWNR